MEARAYDFSLSRVGIQSTSAEIDAVCDLSARTVAAGSALVMADWATYDGKTIRLDTATGSTVTLPAGSGSGARVRFVTHVLATSNSHIVKVANATDILVGSITTTDGADNSNTTFSTTSTSDTVTLNRTTTGSVRIGEMFEVEDVKVGFIAIRGNLVGTGGEATPFSATV